MGRKINNTSDFTFWVTRDHEGLEKMYLFIIVDTPSDTTFDLRGHWVPLTETP